MSNLIDNAVEASPAGEPVRVTIEESSTKGYYVKITDRGSGIPDDILYQIENGKSVTTKEDGNGIGLALGSLLRE